MTSESAADGVSRFAACVEYDGSGFSGWQRQKHEVRTVQGVVETALSKVADHKVPIVTAGRTDTGVHASHQIVHFDSVSTRSLFSWCRGANRFLPHDVRLRWVEEVAPDFHARFSAQSRSYRFVIYNNSVASALYRSLATHEFRPLDVKRMSVAADFLIGTHDFASFRAAGCQASSPVRTVHNVSLNGQGPWLWLDITANAFLQHMVRNIVGSLIEVGCGKRPIEWMRETLESRDRTAAGVTAGANGLYLVGVEYPQQFSLPSRRLDIHYWSKDE